MNNLVGQIFGHLTVTCISELRTLDGHVKWNCQCICGNQVYVAGNELLKGTTKSCGCKKGELCINSKKLKGTRPYNFVDLTTKIFGYYTVLNYNSTLVKWTCRCICGNTRNIRANSLTTGRTTSCGCIRHRLLNREESIKMRLYKHKLKHSKAHNFENTLSYQEFCDIINQPCFYCNLFPRDSHCAVDLISMATKEILTDTKVYYNGIDRIDNSKGYTVGNCVSCCYKCNTAKMDFKKEDFYSWVIKVYNNLKVKGEI